VCPSGGAGLTTYRELCSLANEMGQPDLIYRCVGGGGQPGLLACVCVGGGGQRSCSCVRHVPCAVHACLCQTAVVQSINTFMCVYWTALTPSQMMHLVSLFMSMLMWPRTCTPAGSWTLHVPHPTLSWICAHHFATVRTGVDAQHEDHI
jgi:hypothetical protein